MTPSEAHVGTGQRRGTLFVVSAPSGTGKTTVVKALIARVAGLEMSCSYTSRPPRPGERDGVDYHFVSRDRFEEMRETDEFLESAEVFGALYGTSASETEQRLDEGLDLVLEIDVQGAGQVRALDETAVRVFVLPPSPAVLEERLRSRSATDLTEAQLRQRLGVARREVEMMGDYDYVLINDTVDDCVNRLQCIVVAERARRGGGAAGEAIAQAFRDRTHE